MIMIMMIFLGNKGQNHYFLYLGFYLLSFEFTLTFCLVHRADNIDWKEQTHAKGLWGLPMLYTVHTPFSMLCVCIFQIYVSIHPTSYWCVFLMYINAAYVDCYMRRERELPTVYIKRFSLLSEYMCSFLFITDYLWYQTGEAELSFRAR